MGSLALKQSFKPWERYVQDLPAQEPDKAKIDSFACEHACGTSKHHASFRSWSPVLSIS
jgi:hypothetical protein